MRTAWRISLLLIIAAGGVTHALKVGEAAGANYFFRQDNLPALQRAERLEPLDAGIPARIAMLDPAREDETQRSLNLNPRQCSIWIMRAVRQEQDGDLSGAEESLLRSTSSCRYFVPRWTLAAYYYRREDRAKYLDAARLALSSGTGDPRPLFQMARNLGISPTEVGNMLLPPLPDVHEAYLRFAVDEGDLDAVAEGVEGLARHGSKKDRDAMLSAVNLFLQKGREDQAVDLWNRLAAWKWIEHEPVDPSRRLIPDPTFQRERLGTGFDWRISTLNTLPVIPVESGGIRVELTGQEPEQCEILHHVVVLKTGGHYRFKMRYRTKNIPADSGLRWAVQGGSRRLEFPYLSSEDPKDIDWIFSTPESSGLYTIQLSYGRVPGYTRLKGLLWIESASLEMVSGEEAASK